MHLEHVKAIRAEDEILSQLKTPFVATVLIVDNDHAGAFGFENEKEETSESIGEFRLKVKIRTQIFVALLRGFESKFENFI